MSRRRSGSAWMRRHVSDGFVRQAKAEGYRSRAAYKLLELDAQEHRLRRGARVVDLGAAPGGWSQVAAQRVLPGGRVVAVDLLDMRPVQGVMVIKGDFLESATVAAVQAALDGAQADIVLCDLSPNLSGIRTADQRRAADLVFRAAAFARAVLPRDGVFIAKLFHGEAFDEVVAMLRDGFGDVHIRKPAASRGESRETYAVCRAPCRGGQNDAVSRASRPDHPVPNGGAGD